MFVNYAELTWQHGNILILIFYPKIMLKCWQINDISYKKLMTLQYEHVSFSQ